MLIWITHHYCHLLVKIIPAAKNRPLIMWPTLLVVWLCLCSDIRCRLDSLSHRDAPLFQCCHSPFNLSTHTVQAQLEKQHRNMCNLRETASTSTFFFNQLSVFSWLYRWNFRFPTSEWHKTNTWAYVTFLTWVQPHLQALFPSNSLPELPVYKLLFFAHGFSF